MAEIESAVSLYLASKSPRRRELLEQIGVRYDVLIVDVPEQQSPGESPQDYVQRLAKAKAQAGLQSLLAHSPLSLGERKVVVLGADTIVEYEGDVLEKPLNQSHGLAMLKRLSGREHRVMTAVSICSNEQSQTLCDISRVRFREISEEEALRYWLSGEPADKAGGYGIQGLGGVFVENLQGSYTSVVGLPLYQTHELLRAFSVPVWQRTADNAPSIQSGCA